MTAMDSFTSLLEALEPDYNPDYWSDVVMHSVGTQLGALDQEGWSRLMQEWKPRPVAWRLRLAGALVLVEDPRAMDLLVAMLGAAEPAVGSAVAEALLEKGYRWSPEVSLLADLERHLGQAAPHEQEPIRRLMARLPA